MNSARSSRRSFLPLLLIVVALGATALVHAENPIIQTNFTADPAPMVHDGVVYLYTSHDEDNATGFKMLDWRCYTSTDMVNWTDHGAVASLATFPWAVQSNDAWAPQCVERDGKFYLYVPISVPGSPKNVIAVAVADNPLGPFKDALGRPLIEKADGYIDPTVFVDDDGQAYLYWGNPHLWYVKLNRDMISYAGEIVKVPSTPAHYQEGPWFYHRQGHYYLAYASTCCPEGIGYAMSDHATGPWTYQGYVMKPNEASSGNHPGIIDYKGNAYVFGFNYRLNTMVTDQHRERRSVCVAQLDYDADGTIREVPWWNPAGVEQLGTLDPYGRTEAETIAWSEGIRTEPNRDGGMDAYPTRDRAFIKVKGVNFGPKGAARFLASAARFPSRMTHDANGSAIELHLDDPNGPLIAKIGVSDYSGQWKTVEGPVTGATGTHDLFLVFRADASGRLFKLDYWKFEPRRDAAEPTK
jgi:hypothetical protein